MSRHIHRTHVVIASLVAMLSILLRQAEIPADGTDHQSIAVGWNPAFADLIDLDSKTLDAEEQARLVHALRRHQYVGLDRLIAYRHQRMETVDPASEEIERLNLLVDRVAKQRFAWQSKLFWHTDFASAQQAAKSSHRPILTLRLLGKLDEEFSCANSRYFRTVLYPDPNIAAMLRNQFVLYWEPVREVPIVTIDFGGGRQIRQPLVGNSMHLVINENGVPMDVMPGLVTPSVFHDWLVSARDLWTRADNGAAIDWVTVTQFHQKRAARRRSESPMAIGQHQTVDQLNPLDIRWSQLAADFPVALSAPSRQLLADLSGDPSTFLTNGAQAERAMPIAATKSLVEAPVLRQVRPLELSIARDTAFNLYGLQPQIDDWFSQSNAPVEYQSFTERIYRDLFMMPLDDPWLGLKPDNTLTALDHRKLVRTSSSH